MTKHEWETSLITVDKIIVLCRAIVFYVIPTLINSKILVSKATERVEH